MTAGIADAEATEPLPVEVRPPLRIASLSWSRALAGAVDLFLIAGLVRLGLEVRRGLVGIDDELFDFTPSDRVGGVAIWAVLVGIPLLYHGVIPGSRRWSGLTPGKRLLGLRIVRADGTAISPGIALRRGLFAVVVPLGVAAVWMFAGNHTGRYEFVIAGLMLTIVAAIVDNVFPALRGQGRQTGHDRVARTVVVRARQPSPVPVSMIGREASVKMVILAAAAGMMVLTIGMQVVPRVLDSTSGLVSGETQVVSRADAPDNLASMPEIDDGFGVLRVVSEADAQRLASALSIAFSRCVYRGSAETRHDRYRDCSSPAALALPPGAYEHGAVALRKAEGTPGSVGTYFPRAGREAYVVAWDPAGNGWGFHFARSGSVSKFCESGPGRNCHDVTGLPGRQAWLQDRARIERGVRRAFDRAGMGCGCSHTPVPRSKPRPRPASPSVAAMVQPLL